MLVSLNWLKEFVDVKLQPKEIADRLTMAGLEVEAILPAGDDTVFEVNVTPNRGDCLSVIGIAREIAAITGGKFKIPPNPPLLKGGVSFFPPLKKGGVSFFPPLKKGGEGGFKIKDNLSVEVKDKKKCLRYAARAVAGVKVAPSPKWLIARLESCGIRSINNVVDATNYVMLETGQPFHAFDRRHIEGGRIIVKTPEKEFDFTTLDGVTRKISRNDLLICDGNGAIAIAGVMGGVNSEVKADNTAIILESACFAPSSVRRTSKRLGLSSESSRRFERAVDPSATVIHLNRLAGLIVEIAGGVPSSDWIDIYPKPVKSWRVKFDYSEVKRLVGIEIPQIKARSYLQSLGIGTVKGSCIIPTWRPDLTRPADIVEEVARLHGYDRISVTTPEIIMSSVVKPDHFHTEKTAKEFLACRGFYEAINLGFASPSEIAPFNVSGEAVEISNPLGIEGSVLRTSLLPGLLNNVKLNINYGQDSLKFFELRPVFLREKNGSKEPWRLAGAVYGLKTPIHWMAKREQVDFYSVKGICEGLAEKLGLAKLKFLKKEYPFLRPNASSVITCAGVEIGLLGLLHPVVAAKWDIKNDVAVFELNFDEWAALSLKNQPIYKEMARFPFVRRDVALLIPETVTSNEVTMAAGAYNNQMIKNIFPFDIYKGKGIPEGKKSVAYAVMYADPNRTLTDEEVNSAHTGLVGYLKEKLGAEIR